MTHCVYHFSAICRACTLYEMLSLVPMFLGCGLMLAIRCDDVFLARFTSSGGAGPAACSSTEESTTTAPTKVAATIAASTATTHERCCCPARRRSSESISAPLGPPPSCWTCTSSGLRRLSLALSLALSLSLSVPAVSTLARSLAPSLPRSLSICPPAIWEFGHVPPFARHHGTYVRFLKLVVLDVAPCADRRLCNPMM